MKLEAEIYAKKQAEDKARKEAAQRVAFVNTPDVIKAKPQVASSDPAWLTARASQDDKQFQSTSTKAAGIKEANVVHTPDGIKAKPQASSLDPAWLTARATRDDRKLSQDNENRLKIENEEKAKKEVAEKEAEIKLEAELIARKRAEEIEAYKVGLLKKAQQETKLEEGNKPLHVPQMEQEPSKIVDERPFFEEEVTQMEQEQSKIVDERPFEEKVEESKDLSDLFPANFASKTVESSMLALSVEPEPKPTAKTTAEMWEAVKSIGVQGGSVKSCSMDESVERVEVLLKTLGRPLNVNIDLWAGPVSHIYLEMNINYGGICVYSHSNGYFGYIVRTIFLKNS
jgi:hypothetical protein